MSTDARDHTSTAEHTRPRPWELYFAIASGVTYSGGLVAQFLLHAPQPIFLALFGATYFFGGFFTVKEAFESVRHGRFEVDFLMIVAAVGAASVRKYAEGAVLLFLFSLGEALEEYALSRATRSISALAELAPRTATVRRDDGSTEEVPVSEVRVGDTVVVRPHSRVPSDGFVIEGNPSIDQSAVTGESIPVEKTPLRHQRGGDQPAIPDSAKVFAGTVNGATAFAMCVTAAAEDSTLQRVVKLVEEANVAESPSQVFIERFQRWYVPAVILSVLIVMAVGVLALHDPFSEAFYRSMLVLVAASPCALAIATPAAVLAAIGRAASAGALVKGGLPLETLGKVDVMAFDKTGTLTWGQPTVSDVVPWEGTPAERLEAVALAVESLSDHPLAHSVVAGLEGKIPDSRHLHASSLRAVPGRGVTAVIDGATVRIGTLQLMEDAGISVPAGLRADVECLEDDGKTTMVVCLGSQFLGVIGLMDQPRQESKETLNALRHGGVRRLVMLSGDNQKVAGSVGRLVGVDDAVGGLLPEGKVAKVRELGSGRAVTAVVGDGVNDAPAMANAHVSIAMGAAGSAVALETADIALMGDDLGKVPFLCRLSRATTATIRQNLVIALVVVAFLVPAAFLGLEIGPIVVIHEGSTLLVVLNALRLLRFDKGREHEGIVHEDRPSRSAAAM
jgi:Cd2+/Zn2+-exporting ATPase